MSFPFLFFLLLFSVIWYGRQVLRNPNMLPIHHVNISVDAQHIPIQKLKMVVAKNIHGGFFSLKTAELQNALANLPWVKLSAIRRDWPDTLKVIIKERQPFVRWGKTGVIDKDGQLFFPALGTIPKIRPTLFGPIERLPDVLSLYRQISALTQSIPLGIKSLTLNDRGSWQLQLDGGAQVILGRENMVLRYKQFVSLYPKIIGKNSSKARTIDLRYPNGLAIKWIGRPPKPNRSI